MLIKECGLRPIEVSRLTPKQIDLNAGLVYPETAKGGEARVLKLKQETLTLLRKLVANCTKLDQTIFPKSKSLQGSWNKLRNKLAKRYGKPEIKQIRLYDLRHFYGTMLYQKTKDIVHVQRKMGHRNIKNTLIYIDLVDFKDENYVAKVAETVEEACQLIEAGMLACMHASA